MGEIVRTKKRGGGRKGKGREKRKGSIVLYCRTGGFSWTPVQQGSRASS
jgi:hypothetical protein